MNIFKRCYAVKYISNIDEKETFIVVRAWAWVSPYDLFNEVQDSVNGTVIDFRRFRKVHHEYL